MLSTDFSGSQQLANLLTRELVTVDDVDGGWFLEYGDGDALLFTLHGESKTFDEAFGYRMMVAADGSFYTCTLDEASVSDFETSSMQPNVFQILNSCGS